MSSQISLQHLEKTFGDRTEQQVHAIRDLSLDIPAGQFLAIMGASGSGKTTLLHLMAGLTRPTAGVVSINGRCLSRMTDLEQTLFRRENIGVVFQAFNLIPTLTAEENILLPLLAGNLHLDAARLTAPLDTLLDRLQLQQRRHHYPDTLSGGEQQRVAIARALLQDFVTNEHGGILLADEPTGNLDSANSEIICRLLQEFCRERQHTTVVVTHEPAVAKWADRVIVLKDGQIVSGSLNPDR